MNISMTDLQDLSVSERIQLVEDIWDSIALETPEAIALSSTQREKIQRRLAEHDADPSSAVSWEEVRADLFRRRS